MRCAIAEETLDLPLAVGPKMPITVTGAFSLPLLLGEDDSLRPPESHGTVADRVVRLRGWEHAHCARDAHRGQLGRRLRSRARAAPWRRPGVVRRSVRCADRRV